MSLQYIIDGYNIIHHPIFIRTNKYTRDPHLALLTFIKTKRLTGDLKNKVTLVFDGYPASSAPHYEEDNITIVFSRKISADEKIKQMLEESGNPKNIVVVSSDKEIKFFAQFQRAKILEVEEFITEKQKAKNKDILKPELTYSQMHQINQELRKIWLK